MIDKPGFAVIVEKGRIASFDEDGARGTVVVGSDTHHFHSACFSSRPTRFPKTGEEVEVVFSSPAKSLVRVRELRR